MVSCPTCGKEVSEGDRFCPNCGQTLQISGATIPTRGKLWFWSGVTLLTLIAFIWLIVLIVPPSPPDLVDEIIGLVFITFSPIGLGVYCLKRGSKKISEEKKGEKARRKSIREAAIKALCEHLRLMGLNATVEWTSISAVVPPVIFPKIKGSVRVVNRNIDSVELEWFGKLEGGESEYSAAYWVNQCRCHYVVQARADGLEDKLKAESKPVKVKKGFLRSETVGFQWEGKELAQVLNGDASLKNLLYPADKLALLNKGLIQLPNVEIKPYRKHQCIRIIEKSYTDSPVSAFPTAETFEAYDRIAQHVRSIAARATGVKNG